MVALKVTRNQASNLENFEELHINNTIQLGQFLEEIVLLEERNSYFLK